MNNFSCSPISTSKKYRASSRDGVSEIRNPQISNARLIMPRDLSIDQLTLYLEELGESPLNILLYS